MKKTTMIRRTTITAAFIILMGTCTITSCVQKSAEEEAREQQQHDDSLKAAIIAEMNQKMQPVGTFNTKSSSSNDNVIDASNSANANQDGSNLVTQQQASHLAKEENEITDAKLILNKLNVLLVNAKSRLEVETNELTRVEQFHMGRLKGQREQEIRNQDLRVQAYQNYVEKIQEAIIQEHEKISSLQNNIAQAN